MDRSEKGACGDTINECATKVTAKNECHTTTTIHFIRKKLENNETKQQKVERFVLASVEEKKTEIVDNGFIFEIPWLRP